jgi:hypothetical protein
MTIPDKKANIAPADKMLPGAERGEQTLPEIYEVYHGHLSRRETFAAMAMQGLISDGLQEQRLVARQAVQYADALLKELNK